MQRVHACVGEPTGILGPKNVIFTYNTIIMLPIAVVEAIMKIRLSKYIDTCATFMNFNLLSMITYVAKGAFHANIVMHQIKQATLRSCF